MVDDNCRAITREIARADRLVFFTPVVFGGYHPYLKAVACAVWRPADRSSLCFIIRSSAVEDILS